jgi:hypothetical protein
MVQDESETDRVVAALAACGDYVSVFEYVLLDETVVSNFNIKVHNNPGETPDALVNVQHHRDLVELSAGVLMQLATASSRSADECVYKEKVAGGTETASNHETGCSIVAMVKRGRVDGRLNAIRKPPIQPA